MGPSTGGDGESGAEGGPGGFELSFVGVITAVGGEFLVGDVEEFSQVDFGGHFTEQTAVQDQLGGVAFLVDERFEFAIDGAVADDDIDVDVLR